MTNFGRCVAVVSGLLAASIFSAVSAETPPPGLPAGWQSFRLDADGFAIDRPGTLVAVTPEAARDEITIHAEWRVPSNRGTFYIASFPPAGAGKTLLQWAEEIAADQGPAPVRQVALPRDIPAVAWSWLEAGYYERRVAVHSGRTGRIVALLYAMETNAKTLAAAERDLKPEIDMQDKMAATIRLTR